MAVLPPTVRPLEPPAGSKVNFGAQIDGIDLENLTGWLTTRYFEECRLMSNRQAVCDRP
jgi:hypothetical protein